MSELEQIYEVIKIKCALFKLESPRYSDQFIKLIVDDLKLDAIYVTESHIWHIIDAIKQNGVKVWKLKVGKKQLTKVLT